VEGSLVNVDDLIVHFGDDYGAQLVHELLLLLLQVLVLSVVLEVIIVRPSEPHPISLVTASQGVLVQGIQAKLLLHDEGPLPQAQVAHALEGLGRHQPIDLLLVKLALASLLIGVAYHEASLAPSVDDIELTLNLDARPLPDLRVGHPDIRIRVEAAEAQEDHQSLLLDGELSSDPETQ
jgi:hypothetical protein